jgi:hypothetical protein
MQIYSSRRGESCEQDGCHAIDELLPTWCSLLEEEDDKFSIPNETCERSGGVLAPLSCVWSILQAARSDHRAM